MMKIVQQGVSPHFYCMDYRINRLFVGREDKSRVGRFKVEGDGRNRVWAESIQTYHNRKFRAVWLIDGSPAIILKQRLMAEGGRWCEGDLSRKSRERGREK
jgi:hypothetical protein